MQDSFGLEHVQVGRYYVLHNSFTNNFDWVTGEVFYVTGINGSIIDIEYINDTQEKLTDYLNITNLEHRDIRVHLVFLNTYSTDYHTSGDLKSIRKAKL